MDIEKKKKKKDESFKKRRKRKITEIKYSRNEKNFWPQRTHYYIYLVMLGNGPDFMPYMICFALELSGGSSEEKSIESHPQLFYCRIIPFDVFNQLLYVGHAIDLYGNISWTLHANDKQSNVSNGANIFWYVNIKNKNSYQTFSLLTRFWYNGTYNERILYTSNYGSDQSFLHKFYETDDRNRSL